MATQAFPREKIGRLTLAPLAAFPGFRALLWHENFLYASKGYSLYRMSVRDLENRWQFVASFSPPLWRAFSVRSRLSSRLFRDGFHALAALPSGHMVAAVPGAILSLARGEHQFRVTHRIMRGTRPLHIAVTPQHHIYWGEYFSNQDRDPVHIYGSYDAGNSWNIVYTFASGEVRHVHNIVYDRWN